ncbi:hypothetical protein V2G26_017809 [Clonostachys chloroleuca]
MRPMSSMRRSCRMRRLERAALDGLNQADDYFTLISSILGTRFGSHQAPSLRHCPSIKVLSGSWCRKTQCSQRMYLRNLDQFFDNQAFICPSHSMPYQANDNRQNPALTEEHLHAC